MTELDLFKEIYDDFRQWVLGVEEDDPLPPEIRFVLFVFSSHQNINHLQYVGCENAPKIICSFDYCPLEAQFFYCNKFLKLDPQTALQFCELFVKEIKNDPDFEQLFLNKTLQFVQFGECFKKGI